MFSKAEMVNIAFQIYVPKGTNLSNTRQSTWMNPLINGEEAVKLIGKKGKIIFVFENCIIKCLNKYFDNQITVVI